MRTLLPLFITVWLVCLAGAVQADGIIYRLPADGAFARFEVEFQSQGEPPALRGTGTLTVSSVGQTTEGQRKCRWIELKFHFKLQGRDSDRTYIVKLLIPEEHLRQGASPLDHVVRGWIQHGAAAPVPLENATGPQAGPLFLLLGGPLENAKKLEPKRIETKAGEWSCGGLSGTSEFETGKQTTRVNHELRLSEQAPFGLVTARLQIEVRRDGEDEGAATLRLKLAEIGNNAQSALPDHN